jgi:hypothetical protein
VSPFERDLEFLRKSTCLPSILLIHFQIVDPFPNIECHQNKETRVDISF